MKGPDVKHTKRKEVDTNDSMHQNIAPFLFK